MNNEIVAEREQQELDALTRVQSWEVKTPEDFRALDSFLVGLAELKKKIVADFKDSKDKAFAAHRAICAQEKSHLDKVEEAYRFGKQKLVKYEDEQRAEEQRRQAIADAKAKKEAEDAALAAAAEAEKSGDKEKAAAIISEPIQIQAPRLASMVPERSTKVSTRWGAVVGGTYADGTSTDPEFVIKAVRESLAFMEKAKTPAAKAAADRLRLAAKDLEYMTYDTVKLNRQATATKDAVRLGGVAFVGRKV